MSYLVLSDCKRFSLQPPGSYCCCVAFSGVCRCGFHVMRVIDMAVICIYISFYAYSMKVCCSFFLLSSSI